ncbi:MAG: membrane protein [Alphaproteobacteria bacterium]|nr:MAG: membrane protein [Alphaproteobacteria bacterium]
MPVHEMAAVAAAACWALSGIVSAAPVAHLGPVAFTRIRMAMVLVLLAAWVALAGSWRSIAPDQLAPVVLSGIIGVFVGDTMLFMALNRIGPRRSSIVFSMHAPISVMLGWLVLDEVLTAQETAGIGIVVAGVVLAIVFGKRRSQLHQWESIKGSLAVGVAIGLGAALCQAIGSLIARPVMAAGADPVAVSALRVAAAVACFYVALWATGDRLKPAAPLTASVAVVTAFSGVLAMALGMTLVLFALSGGEVGIVSTLSAMAPVLILPLIWWRTREMPAPAAWLGALLATAGMALIFIA